MLHCKKKDIFRHGDRIRNIDLWATRFRSNDKVFCSTKISKYEKKENQDFDGQHSLFFFNLWLKLRLVVFFPHSASLCGVLLPHVLRPAYQVS